MISQNITLLKAKSEILMTLNDLLTEGKILFFGSLPLEEEEENRAYNCCLLAFKWLARQITSFKPITITHLTITEDTPQYLTPQCRFIIPEEDIAFIYQISYQGRKVKQVPFFSLNGFLKSIESRQNIPYSTDMWSFYQGSLYYFSSTESKEGEDILKTLVCECLMKDIDYIPDELEDCVLQYYLWLLCNSFPSSHTKKANEYYTRCQVFLEKYKSDNLIEVQSVLRTHK